MPDAARPAVTDHDTPALAAGSAETLLAFLDYLREAVARKRHRTISGRRRGPEGDGDRRALLSPVEDALRLVPR